MSTYEPYFMKEGDVDSLGETDGSIKTYSTINRNGKRINIKVGESRVVLINDTYDSAPNVPVWGTEFGCVGTVRTITPSGTAKVHWDNGMVTFTILKDLGTLTTYHNKEESPPARKEENPNTAFKLEKMQRDVENWGKDTMKTPNACKEEIDSVWGEVGDLLVDVPEEVDNNPTNPEFWKKMMLKPPNR